MLSEEEIKKLSESASAGLPREERDKHRALFAGVIFFMILIVFLWMINLGNVVRPFTIKEKKTFDIDKFSKEFQESYNEVGARMEGLKQISPELLNSISTTTVIKNK